MLDKALTWLYCYIITGSYQKLLIMIGGYNLWTRLLAAFSGYYLSKECCRRDRRERFQGVNLMSRVKSNMSWRSDTVQPARVAAQQKIWEPSDMSSLHYFLHWKTHNALDTPMMSGHGNIPGHSKRLSLVRRLSIRYLYVFLISFFLKKKESQNLSKWHKLPNSQPPNWGQPFWMTWYIPKFQHHWFIKCIVCFSV